jgi:Domain of unknown function (DUF5069)
VDLTKEYPRSVHAKWQGIVQLGRAVDKGKAKAAGTQGEYNYDCPMDKAVFEFLAIDGDKLLEVIGSAKGDAEIEAYTRPFVAAKSAEEIENWNREFVKHEPEGGESLAYFTNLRDSIDPSRTDITTWADVLDLDEKRDVPRRTPAAV